MFDWYEIGQTAGAKLIETGGTTFELPAEDMGIDDIKKFIDGFVDSATAGGVALKGFRLSNALISSIRAFPGVANDHYRDIPFAPDINLWPDNKIELVTK